MKWAFLLPLGLSLYACAVLSAVESRADPASAGHGPRMRIGAAQPRARLVDYRLTNPAEVLAQVDRSLGELEQIVHQAAAAKCDAIALPEDTLGLGAWEAAHKTTLREVLPEAVKRMLDRLGRAAAAHRMYLVCCNDTLDPDGSLRNTAFFLGRDGRELGHYHKVNMPIHDPFGGREGGDAMNSQSDMRARLFRERSPAAFGTLTDPDPPVLSKVPEAITIAEAVRISAGVLTAGDQEFNVAAALAGADKTNEAITAFRRLRSAYRDSWVDRVSAERLARLGAETDGPVPERKPVNDAAAASNPPARTTLSSGPNIAPPLVARGLAAKYPGDAGIARDPDVLFAENFETGSVQEIGKRWGAISNQDGKVMAFSDDVPPVSAGKRSLQMTATLGENTGGHLYARLPHGADKVFARFYVKFASDAGYLHHFVTLGGYHPATAWPQGGAGERPRGDERFTAGIEPYGNYGRYPAPGAWNFYAYWPEMKGSADGRFWGNSLTPAQPALVPRNRWQCVEVMLQCNSAPDKSDGELALWLEGNPTLHLGPGAPRSRWTGLGFSLVDQGGEPFEGFRWRTSRDLQINFFWLLHYVTENAPRQNHAAAPNPINRVWFDDIVVSTAYVGPISR
ncbi:MAG: nitrilase-related carbon-nitrogen hydrolase [Limisphaerales bacterium]